MAFSRLIEPRTQIPDERKWFTNRQLFQMILPVIIEQFLILLVGIIDTLMISYAGEAAVSGVSLVDQVNTIFIYIFTAVASGGGVVIGQYIGSRRREDGNRAAGQLLMLTLLISAGIMVLTLVFRGGVITGLFGRAEAEVQAAARTYLRISAYSYPFLAVYNSCAAQFRSMGNTGTIMKVSMLMNGINVAGNAIGIFVLHAGVAGVAYPTLIARAVAAAILLVLACNQKLQVCIQRRHIFMCDSEMIRRIFHIAIPNGVENGLFQISKVALSAIVALFGTVQIAANGVAQSFWSMAALVCYAMGPVFLTVVSQYMGARDPDGAVYYIRKMLRITFFFSFLWNMLCLLLTPLILRFYQLSPEAVRLVLIMVVMHNFGNFILVPPGFTLSNALRAAGDVRFPMAASIVSTVICRVALTVLFGLVMRMGVIGVTLAMCCDWAIKAILILYRYHSGKWKNYKVI